MKRAGILKIILSVFLCSLAFFVVPASPQSIPYPHDILSESSLYIYTLNLGNYLEMANTNYGTSIVNSFNDNFGIFNLNQSSGSLNNQANVSTITVTPGSAGRTLFDIDLDQLDGSFGNTISYFGTIHRESIIENSFERSKGLFMVNQSPGNLNQQSNIFALSLGLGSALMLSDFELATKSGENIIQYGPDTVLENKDIINNSFSGVTGVVLINQTSGDLNIIRNNVGISFSKETIR